MSLVCYAKNKQTDIQTNIVLAGTGFIHVIHFMICLSLYEECKNDWKALSNTSRMIKTVLH